VKRDLRPSNTSILYTDEKSRVRRSKKEENRGVKRKNEGMRENVLRECMKRNRLY